MSQGEGSIALHARGKQLPLFSRAIYAADVQENIMSVPEACDRGYAVVFTQKGVQLFNPEDVKLRGAPVLSGGRDKRSRLFYFDFPSPLLKGRPLLPSARRSLPSVPPLCATLLLAPQKSQLSAQSDS